MHALHIHDICFSYLRCSDSDLYIAHRTRTKSNNFGPNRSVYNFSSYKFGSTNFKFKLLQSQVTEVTNNTKITPLNLMAFVNSLLVL